MRNKILILLLFIIKLGYSQSVPELELELRQTVISDLDKIKSICDKIFTLDKYNETATYFLIESYKCQSFDSPEDMFFAGGKSKGNKGIDYTDSINAFFDNLIREDKLNPEPYILQAKILHARSENLDSAKISLLETAVSLDKNNIQGNYLLGLGYYNAFNKEINDSTSIIHPNDYASNSFDYLKIVYQNDSKSRMVLSYPLIQLANYIDKPDNDLDNYNQTTHEYYFPLQSFGEIPNNWQTDYTVNLIRELDLAEFVVSWYSGQLKAMDEPVLKDIQNGEVYRFTWLRTFHNPITIRLTKKENEINLTWKQCDGAGGYSPGKLTIDKSKKLSQNDWETFLNMLREIDYWNLPTNEPDVMGCDGAQWILEGVNEGRYHVVDRWTPRNTDFSKVCMYLLDLTNLKIKEKEKY